MSHPKFSPTLLRNPLSLDFNHRQSPTLLSAIGLLTLISLGIVLPYKADGASEPTKQVKVESSQWQSVEDQKETIKRQLSALRDEKFSLKEQLDKVQTQLVKRLPTAEAIESKCYGRAWDEALAQWCKSQMSGFIPEQERLEAQKETLTKAWQAKMDQEQALDDKLDQLSYRQRQLEKEASTK